MVSKSHLAISVTCVVLMLGVLTGVGVYIWHHDYDTGSDVTKDQAALRALGLGDSVTVQISDKRMNLNIKSRTDQAVILRGFVAHQKDVSHMTKCELEGEDKDGDALCWEWENGFRIEMFRHDDNADQSGAQLNCFTVHWRAPDTNQETETPEDCYDMSGYFWFGGFEEASQIWPMNSFHMNSSAFVTGDTYKPFVYGSVIEGVFLSSSGVGIYMDETSPLYLSINSSDSGLLCLKGKVGGDTPFFGIRKPFLKYDICRSPDVVTLWKGLSARHLAKPRNPPSPDVMRHPIWCTWAPYKSHINETTVLDFAEQIRLNNFSISQLEIDDEWTSRYGDFDFTPEKFPHAAALIQNLTKMGIPVTVWMHPFFNNDSRAFDDLSEKGYLIKDVDTNDTHIIEWWRGKHAGVLDLTNPEAQEWYLERVKDLKDTYNVTSFKFDAGEVKYVPGAYRLNSELTTPNYLTRNYVEMALKADPEQRRQEVRVGYRSQGSTVMIRMMDRDSNWSHRLGIKTLIPCALTLGLMGYPYVLPDMIGGNAYDASDIDLTVLPNRELFVRWLQATVFMPTLQLSVAPWAYDEAVVEITRRYIRLHEDYADKIIALAEHARRTGEPIVRPMWWADPHDQTALQLDSQFLLGDDLLVAPVLDQGALSRDVYLPKGRWRDEVNGMVLEGGAWIRNFSAPLEVLPYFTKVD